MEFEINQVVHGYRKGHRRIAGSLELPPNCARLIDAMSDFSGSSREKGFEEYVTGYPVFDSEYYAFAKTWYAEEMPRPGCVWTHTLLIKKDDLKEISVKDLLLSFSDKPTEKIQEGNYEKRIFLKSRNDDTFDSDEIDVGLARRIFENLYGKKTSAVLIRADDSKKYLKTMLAIWSRQWSSLKKNFSFCSGSIILRAIGKAPLNLQVVPLAYREGRTSFENKIQVIDNNDYRGDVSSNESWITSLTSSLLDQRKAKVQIFLEKMDSGSSLENNYVVNLINIFNASERKKVGNYSSSDINAKADIDEIKNANVLLRLIILSKEFNLDEFKFVDRLMCGGDVVFDGDAEISSVDVREVWKNRFSEFVGLIEMGLARDSANEFFKKLLMDFSRDIDAEKLLSISESAPKLFSSVAMINPEILGNESLWGVGEGVATKLWDVGRTGFEKNKNLLWSVIKYIVEKKYEGLIFKAIRRYPEETGKAISRWWLSDPKKNIEKTVLRTANASIEKFENYCVENGIFEIDNFQKLITLILSSMELEKDVKWISWDRWGLIFSPNRNSMSDRQTRTLAFRCLIRGLAGSGDEDFEFLCMAFETVHNALAESLDFDGDVWEELGELAPPIHYWKSWDKCERVRVAVKKKIERGNFDKKKFINSLLDQSLRKIMSGTFV